MIHEKLQEGWKEGGNYREKEEKLRVGEKLKREMREKKKEKEKSEKFRLPVSDINDSQSC